MTINKRALLSLILAASAGMAAYGQSARIVVDGVFDDWDGLTPAYVNAPSGGAGVDFGRLWVANDERYLFIRIEVGAELLIQEGNQIVLFVDADDDSNTGRGIHGIGADFEWHFGSRTGTTYSPSGSPSPLEHADVGIVTGPTVSSNEFEVAFDLDAKPDGSNRLFDGPSIRVVMEDRGGGDRLPDVPGGIRYSLADPSMLPQLEMAALGREQPSDVRMLSYNVERDGLFDAGRSPAFRRILRALGPDIIGFQEVLGHSAAETEQVVSALLSLPAGEEWHSDRISDIVVVSRYPIVRSFPLRGVTNDPSNGAFLLDLRSVWATDLLVVMAHPPCCRADEARQVEIDAMMAFVRDAMTEGGVVDLDDGTPVILLGDLNLVGFAQQLTTLLAGDIVNTGLFGEPFQPDWDGTHLADLMPRHTSLPMTFTWYNEESSFHPGRLDYMIFTDSVLEPQNSYVLFTPSLPSDTLAAHGLMTTDATVASDHLPVVGDFRYVPIGTGMEGSSDLAKESFRHLRHFPNPVVDVMTLTFELRHPQTVSITVFDLLGRVAYVGVSAFRSAGIHHETMDLGALAPGVYVYHLRAGERIDTGRVVVIR